MAAKATNKTIWTVALIAVLVILAWKLWPALRSALNRLGGGSGGSGGGVGGGPSYYPNPYQQNPNSGGSNGQLSLPGLPGSGNNGNYGSYNAAQDEVFQWIKNADNDAADYNTPSNPYASGGVLSSYSSDYTSGLDLPDSENQIQPGPLQSVWDNFQSWLDQGYSPGGDSGAIGQNSAQAALQDQSDELQVQDADINDQIGESDDLGSDSYDDAYNDAAGGDASGGDFSGGDDGGDSGGPEGAGGDGY